MVYRGCVLSLEKEYAVVMTAEAEYVKINRKNGLAVGKQILFLEDDMYRKKRTAPLYMIKYAAVFVIVLFAAIFQFYNNGMNRFDNNVAAIVTLDINPSLEIEINNEGRTIGLIPLNKEGAVIVDSSMIGGYVDTVIPELLKKAEAKEYFKYGDNFVLISMTTLIEGLNTDLSDIKANISNIISDDDKLKEINIIYTSGNRTALEKSRLNKISAGRYHLYEELKSMEPGITIEAARNMKLKELINRQRFRSKGEASVEETIRSVIYEDACEYMLLKERQHIQGGADSPDPHAEIGNENRRGKGNGIQQESRRMGSEERKPEEEYKEVEDTKTEENKDGLQQSLSTDREQQNQLQYQNGVFEESVNNTESEVIVPEEQRTGEKRKIEKGKKSDNEGRNNDPPSKGNRE